MKKIKRPRLNSYKVRPPVFYSFFRGGREKGQCSCMCSPGVSGAESGGNQDWVEIEYYKLAYGSRFKYNEHGCDIWIKIPDGLIAEYDKKYMTIGGWQGQKICSFGFAQNRKVWVGKS